MAEVKGSALGLDWETKKEQTKNLKNLSWRESIQLDVRTRGLQFVHRELKRLEVSSTTGLLVSPFRKCEAKRSRNVSTTSS